MSAICEGTLQTVDWAAARIIDAHGERSLDIARTWAEELEREGLAALASIWKLVQARIAAHR